MSENKDIDPKLNEILKGMWDSLTDEQKEKAKACKTMEELTALAGKSGVELPDEALDAVAGGCDDDIWCIDGLDEPCTCYDENMRGPNLLGL